MAARSVACLSNIRQLSNATVMWANDHRGMMPAGGGNTCYRWDPISFQIKAAGGTDTGEERKDNIADWIAWFSGSMSFLLLNLLWFGIWILINVAPVGIPHFDPFPFGLLTMIVSLEAIFLSCFVLISQNRQSEKDHVRSDIEYDVNIKAELEVSHLHEKVDRLYEEMLQRLARLEAHLKRGP
jgi:uncharacterized membrane protein